MKTIEVSAAVIIEQSRVFATQRGYGEYIDSWEFPGGKLEPGESPREALKREIREELDTEVDVGQHKGETDHTRQWRFPDGAYLMTEEPIPGWTPDIRLLTASLLHPVRLTASFRHTGGG